MLIVGGEASRAPQPVLVSAPSQAQQGRSANALLGRSSRSPSSGLMTACRTSCAPASNAAKNANRSKKNSDKKSRRCMAQTKNQDVSTRMSRSPSDDGGFAVLLDGRPLKTPSRSAYALPSRELAEAIADEWRGQGDEIDPDTMPLTRLVNTRDRARAGQSRAGGRTDAGARQVGSALLPRRISADAGRPPGRSIGTRCSTGWRQRHGARLATARASVRRAAGRGADGARTGGLGP